MDNMDKRTLAIIEGLDPSRKVARLQEELDGDPNTGAPGLRTMILTTYRDLKAQERLIASRKAMEVPAAQTTLAADDLNRAEYARNSYKAALAYLTEQIEQVEAELAQASKIGTREVDEPGPVARPEQEQEKQQISGI